MKKETSQAYDLAQRAAESLADIADVTAIYGSKSEILIKAEPKIDLSGLDEAVKSRLAGLGFKVEVMTTSPRLLIRLKPMGIGNKSSNIPWLNIILFILTVISTLIAGAMLEGVDPLQNNALWVNPFGIFAIGLPFSISLLSIMLFHEFGHYIASRKHNVEVTLPYFLPSPFMSFIGTFGAIIRSKSAFINRRQLLDVGAAGPLAGLAAAFVVLIVGIKTSAVIPLSNAGPGAVEMGESLLYKALEYLLRGPVPESQALMLNSVAVAGWAGMLITMINLMPIGQLDGGHIIYAMFGRKQKYFAYGAVIGLMVLSFFWIGWALWLIISIFIRPLHPPTIMDDIELGTGRKIVGYLCIVAFILCFMPIPVSG
jgi:membrane-associated protease RseP (regulator of RpoE activity)